MYIKKSDITWFWLSLYFPFYDDLDAKKIQNLNMH